ncbi:MAG: DUF433 domain-containing protein [Bryobacteraceae bacterium]
MNLKPPFERITIEPAKMGGRPCIRGMRITVRRVLEILATYPERRDLFNDYPDLQEEDIRQALELQRPLLTAQSMFTSMPHEARRSRSGAAGDRGCDNATRRTPDSCWCPCQAERSTWSGVS